MSATLLNKVTALSLLEDLLFTNVKGNGKTRAAPPAGREEEEDAMDFDVDHHNHQTETTDDGESGKKRIARYKAVLYLPFLCYKMGPQWTKMEVIFFLIRCVQEDDAVLTFLSALALASLLIRRRRDECYTGKWATSSTTDSDKADVHDSYVSVSDAIPLIELLCSQREPGLRAFMADVVLPLVLFGVDISRGRTLREVFLEWDRRYLSEAALGRLTAVSSPSADSTANAGVGSLSTNGEEEETVKRLILYFESESSTESVKQSCCRFYAFLAPSPTCEHLSQKGGGFAEETPRTLPCTEFLPFIESERFDAFTMYAKSSLYDGDHSTLIASPLCHAADSAAAQLHTPAEGFSASSSAAGDTVTGTSILSEAPLYLSRTAYHFVRRSESGPVTPGSVSSPSQTQGRHDSSASSCSAKMDYFSALVCCRDLFSAFRAFLDTLPNDRNIQFLIKSQHVGTLESWVENGDDAPQPTNGERMIRQRQPLKLSDYMVKKNALEERQAFLFQLLENLMSSRFSGAVSVAVALAHRLIALLTHAERCLLRLEENGTAGGIAALSDGLNGSSAHTASASSKSNIKKNSPLLEGDFTVMVCPSVNMFSDCRTETHLLARLDSLAEQQKVFHVVACVTAAYASDAQLLEYYSLLRKAYAATPADMEFSVSFSDVDPRTQLAGAKNTLVRDAVHQARAKLYEVLIQARSSIYVMRSETPQTASAPLPIIGPGPVELRVRRHACQDLSSLHYNMNASSSTSAFLSNSSFFAYYTDRTVLMSLLQSLPQLLSADLSSHETAPSLRPSPVLSEESRSGGFSLQQVLFVYYQFILPSTFIFDRKRYPWKAGSSGFAGLNTCIADMLDEMHLFDTVANDIGAAEDTSSGNHQLPRPRAFSDCNLGQLLTSEESVASLDYRIVEELLLSVESLFLQVAQDIVRFGRALLSTAGQAPGTPTTTGDVQDTLLESSLLHPLLNLYMSTVLSCAVNNNWKSRYLLLTHFNALSSSFLRILIEVNETPGCVGLPSVLKMMHRFCAAQARLWRFVEGYTEADARFSSMSVLAELFVDAEQEIRIVVPRTLTSLVSLMAFAAARLSLPSYAALTFTAVRGKEPGGGAGADSEVLPLDRLVNDPDDPVAALLRDLFWHLTQNSIREKSFKVRVEAVKTLAATFYNTWLFADLLEHPFIVEAAMMHQQREAPTSDQPSDALARLRSFVAVDLREQVLQPVSMTLMALVNTSSALTGGSAAAAGAGVSQDPNPNVMLVLVVEVTNMLLFQTAAHARTTSAGYTGGVKGAAHVDVATRHNTDCSFLSLLENLELLNRNPLWRYRELFALLFTNVLYKFVRLRASDPDGQKVRLLLRDSAGTNAAAEQLQDATVMEEYLLPQLAQSLFDKAKAVRDSALRYTAAMIARLRAAGEGQDFADKVLWPYLLEARNRNELGLRTNYLLRMQLIDVAGALRVDKRRYLIPLLEESSRDAITNVRMYAVKAIKRMLLASRRPSSSSSAGATVAPSSKGCEVLTDEDKSGWVMTILRCLLEDAAVDIRDEAAAALAICF